MAFLAGLAADVIEWLLSKIFAVVGKDFSQWQASRKSDKALATNQAALQAAFTTGDPNEIAKAGQDSLNNSGGN